MGVKRQRFAVVAGGGAHVLRALALDLGLHDGDAGLPAAVRATEVAALAQASGSGLDILLMDGLAPENRFVRAELAALGHVALFGGEAGLPVDAAHSRAESLARCCMERGYGMANVAVVATRPQDLEAMLSAGLALALPGAGRDCMAAADRVLRTRTQGGVEDAAMYALRWGQRRSRLGWEVVELDRG